MPMRPAFELRVAANVPPALRAIQGSRLIKRGQIQIVELAPFDSSGTMFGRSKIPW